MAARAQSWFRGTAMEALEGRRLFATAPAPIGIASLTLLNARTDAAIGTLSNNQTINLGTTGNELSVRAFTSPSKVGSVRFEIDGRTTKVETSQPYSILGEVAGDYRPWTPTPGQHTLVVTPYTEANGGGAVGRPLTIKFTISSGSPTPTPPPGGLDPNPPALPRGPDPRIAASREPHRHQEFLARIRQGPINLLFLGDSITDAWSAPGNRQTWSGYAQYQAAEFGVAGDMTQNLLWRITHGELDGIKPKVIVLLIGTNNFDPNARNTDAHVAAGITTVVNTIKQKLPTTRILLLGLFPRGYAANDPHRARIRAVNQQISRLDDGGRTVKYLDLASTFLEPDGSISKETSFDGLHLTVAGYTKWAKAMKPTLTAMMR